MPSSSIQTFSDPDAYAASIPYSTSDITITERGSFAAQLVDIHLRYLYLRRFTDTLARIAHNVPAAGGVSIQFRTEQGPTLLAAGFELQTDKILRHVPGDDYYQLSSGSSQFAGLALWSDDLIDIGEPMAGFDLASPRSTLLVSPESAAMARLRRLHAAAVQLAEIAPEIIANAHAANGLEQTLIDAMISCLNAGGREESSFAQRQHTVVIRRFRRTLEENPDEPLYVPEMCKAIGVSDSTLRACCNEHLGMGPRRYLTIRRLNLARRALRDTAPGASSVTDIATRYGFWHLARFAGEYRSLFGESPSATLRR